MEFFIVYLIVLQFIEGFAQKIILKYQI